MLEPFDAVPPQSASGTVRSALHMKLQLAHMSDCEGAIVGHSLERNGGLLWLHANMWIISGLSDRSDQTSRQQLIRINPCAGGTAPFQVRQTR